MVDFFVGPDVTLLKGTSASEREVDYIRRLEN